MRMEIGDFLLQDTFNFGTTFGGDEVIPFHEFDALGFFIVVDKRNYRHVGYIVKLKPEGYEPVSWKSPPSKKNKENPTRGNLKLGKHRTKGEAFKTLVAYHKITGVYR